MHKFLNKCARIEETTALVYHEFARQQICDPSLAAAWLKMARDEEDHAQQLRLALRLHLRNLNAYLMDYQKQEPCGPDCAEELSVEALSS